MIQEDVVRGPEVDSDMFVQSPHTNGVVKLVENRNMQNQEMSNRDEKSVVTLEREVSHDIF